MNQEATDRTPGHPHPGGHTPDPRRAGAPAPRQIHTQHQPRARAPAPRPTHTVHVSANQGTSSKANTHLARAVSHQLTSQRYRNAHYPDVDVPIPAPAQPMHGYHHVAKHTHTCISCQTQYSVYVQGPLCQPAPGHALNTAAHVTTLGGSLARHLYKVLQGLRCSPPRR